MLDRDKVLNWWTGRISDAELAEWSGMAPRAVAIVLGLPSMRGHVTGGGRGSRHTRRIAKKAKGAVAIIHALSEAGLSLELASNIVDTTSVIASQVIEAVDYIPDFGGFRSLCLTEPDGRWLPTDVVHARLWGRFVIPCRRIDDPNPSPGSIIPIPEEEFSPNERGTMIIHSVELVPLTDKPVYAGEYDPIGLYERANSRPEAIPALDEHLLIVDGRWIFSRSPDPSPLETLYRIHNDGEVPKPTFHLEPVSLIEPDKKTVRVIAWGRDPKAQDQARRRLENYESLLDVNLTLPVRRMKRRAYGLPVEVD
ncbi:hypothetical protein [Constrictibacter sp. MBR-5]|uniref:hypothetical protein n=1 Tax=Constrictibacter sp. MBR-5 TaxID=3156467 RepID=UPI003390CFDB